MTAAEMGDDRTCPVRGCSGRLDHEDGTGRIPSCPVCERRAKWAGRVQWACWAGVLALAYWWDTAAGTFVLIVGLVAATWEVR